MRKIKKLALLLWVFLFWSTATGWVFGGTLNTLKVHVHRCEWYINNPNSSIKTIVIEVRRPVTLKKIHEFWLQPCRGTDLNRDGIVNLKDYAVWAGQKGQ